MHAAVKVHTRSIAALVAAAVLWHVLAMLSPAWVTVAAKPSKGRDFATYYFAVHAAADGEDPTRSILRGLGGLSRGPPARRAAVAHPVP